VPFWPQVIFKDRALAVDRREAERRDGSAGGRLLWSFGSQQIPVQGLQYGAALT
jgi:hypothetical protein